MKAPDKVYLEKERETNKISNLWGVSPVLHSGYEHIEYIHKDIVDEMLKTAEDHAYFAGQEKFREKLIEWTNKMLQDTADRLDFHGNQAFAELYNKLNSM